jgi:hypothetical protein
VSAQMPAKAASGEVRISRMFASRADARRVAKEFAAAGFTKIATRRVKCGKAWRRTWRVRAVVKDAAAFAKWLVVEAKRDVMRDARRARKVKGGS